MSAEDGNVSAAQIKPFEVHIQPVSGQILRLEPVVAGVFGGGTSAVVIRGDAQRPDGGVRVSVEQQRTSAASSGSSF